MDRTKGENGGLRILSHSWFILLSLNRGHSVQLQLMYHVGKQTLQSRQILIKQVLAVTADGGRHSAV